MPTSLDIDQWNTQLRKGLAELCVLAAVRRLGEEMGFTCPLQEFGTITNRADLDRGLVEHEFVHVFRGTFDGEMALNPEEVDGIRWMTPEALLAAFDATPGQFTAWFVKYMRAGWPLERPLIAG